MSKRITVEISEDTFQALQRLASEWHGTATDSAVSIQESIQLCRVALESIKELDIRNQQRNLRPAA